MAISRDDVLRVAALARLDLDEDSVESLAADLGQIVDYVRKLEELDTVDVPPTAQVAVLSAPLRPDENRPGTPTEVALREAPRSTAEGFRVPAFVDES
jgi:aspartyl-tRNA(Asn)/glutamyl-tRNA(Gln) amidotransferase subunit C